MPERNASLQVLGRTRLELSLQVTAMPLGREQTPAHEPQLGRSIFSHSWVLFLPFHHVLAA